MDLDKHIEAATKAVNSQLEANHKSLVNKLDAADRMLMQKAVDATIRLAQVPITDPTK